MDMTMLRAALDEPFTGITLSLPGQRSGKVREIFSLPDNRMLLVTTDRLSAFDRILGAAPYKGQVLNQLSAWWFERTRQIADNHLEYLPDPNAAVVQSADTFPIEVIVRGYITGVTSTALWYRYSLGERGIYGHRLPEAMRKNQALPQPVITPTTKGGVTGHDERLTPAEVVDQGYLDRETWDTVQQAAMDIFTFGQKTASQAGLILVDTKYEFGRSADGRILLVDEVHTPDSSRFWRADTYQERFEAGEEPENFDKEFVRLEYARLGYRGDGDPPDMPSDLWLQVSERYVTLYERLTGEEFVPGEYPVAPRLEANLRKASIIDG